MRNLDFSEGGVENPFSVVDLHGTHNQRSHGKRKGIGSSQGIGSRGKKPGPTERGRGATTGGRSQGEGRLDKAMPDVYKIRGRRVGTPEQRYRIAAGSLKSAKQAEKHVTPTFKAAAAARGGEMDGLKNRFKAREKIAGKIVRVSEKKNRDWARTPQELASTLKDNLRYTFLTKDNPGHATDVDAFLKDLKSKGYSWNEDKQPENNWVTSGPYKGINMDIKDPNGYEFELQFHSPESMKLKHAMHPIYERARKLAKDDPVRAELDDQMQAMSDRIPLPPGIEKIGHPA